MESLDDMARDADRAIRRDLDCDLCYPENHVGCVKTQRSHSAERMPTGDHRRCARHRTPPPCPCGGTVSHVSDACPEYRRMAHVSLP